MDRSEKVAAGARPANAQCAMTPEQYEHHVAQTLRDEGWAARVTPHVRDFGVDIVATKGDRRLAVQVKLYGAARRIGGRAVMEFFGAATYADCPEMMIATNGTLLPAAQAIASKLGIAVRYLAPETSSAPTHASDEGGDWTFGEIWRDHVRPLAGTTLVRPGGKSNEITKVDEAGLVRVTSNGRTQRIDIEIFRWAIEKLLAGQPVTRAEINDRYPGRASSGIILILASLPMFDRTTLDGREAVVRRPNGSDQGARR
ncbi:MAG: restriction endonuclease [Actinomycetota bacterium]